MAGVFSEDNFGETFSDLDLHGESIVGKEFEACTFVNCDFSEARFQRSVFDDCRFIRCNLSVLDLSGSKFTQTAFEACKLSGVDWTKAHYSDLIVGSPYTFLNSVLDYASFYGLNMQHMVMRECRVHDADFRECDLTSADLRESDFSDSLFRNTNLGGADLTLAENYRIDIHVNTIKGARFSRYEALSLLDSLEITLVD